MKNNKGFSLVELIVVIAIMAILAAVAIPTFASFITKAQDASNVQEVSDLVYAAELACMEYEVDVTPEFSDDKTTVTLTFVGEEADKAAQQVAGICENAVADETEVTLAFTKAVSEDGAEDVNNALAKLDKYAPEDEDAGNEENTTGSEPPADPQG